jgi:hypothetical protein
MKPLRLLFSLSLILIITFAFNPIAWAFCGFYVSKADAKLYNNASQVVIARDGDRTILTMANDFQGDVKDFAIVVPVPTILKQEQVRIGDAKIIERLDAFSAPRLVEYFDSDPCAPMYLNGGTLRAPASVTADSMAKSRESKNSLGVTIEEKFTVGEYDILILSAKESGGLETWLIQNGYRIPSGANQVLQAYIRQNMKFFVAKVNLKELAKLGDTKFLRPLMMAFESKRFMLPIRLGMVNAKGDQDLLVYVLSPRGQVEVSNYRTVNIPSDAEIPVFVKNEFGSFYKAMFQTAHRREDRRVAFLEYAWDMGSCDPCSAEPLSSEELTKAGVFWLNNPQNSSSSPSFNSNRRSFRPNNGVFITRLHIRYNRKEFPEDLMFQQTSNQRQFQGRYILRHAFLGQENPQCEAGKQYQQSLPQRFEREAQTLAQLTDWKINDIRRKIPAVKSTTNPIQQFWQNIWK